MAETRAFCAKYIRKYREFVEWIFEANKKCIIIGTIGASSYKEIFPLIRDNKLWIGATNNGQDMVFSVPDGTKVDPKDKAKAEKLGYVGNYTRLGNACWYTNVDHGRRHQPLALMTMADNLKYSKHKDLIENGYCKYYNYDAIEVPYIDSIPSDFSGVMGVPLSFLDKYNPDQFEIIGLGSGYLGRSIGISGILPEHKQQMKGHSAAGDLYYLDKNNIPRVPYARILIRKKV